MKTKYLMLCALAAALSLCPAARAQSLMGRNLVVDGDAEDGTGISTFEDTPVAPNGWTVKGKLTLAQYDGEELFNTGDGIPPKDHGKNYFSGGTEGKASSATQAIDVSAEAAAIDGNSALFTFEGYIGGDFYAWAELKAVFKKSDGTVLLTPALNPVKDVDRPYAENALLLRTTTGLVPAGTRSIEIQLDMIPDGQSVNFAGADNISLVLSNGTMYGGNLIRNSDAEAGETAEGGETVYPVPRWNVKGGMTTVLYGEPEFPTRDVPGPADRGQKFFTGGGEDSDTAYGWQVFEVGGMATTIDAGAVNWSGKAWLGGYEDQRDSAGISFRFYDAGGKLLDETKIDPVTPEDRGNQTALLERAASGTVPAGTRRVEVWLTMTLFDGAGYNDGYADNVSFTLTSNAPAAVIKDGGVVNAASGQTGPIAPGEIVSIYGSGLGPANAVGMETSGTGQLLTTRAGVKVLVNDAAAPLLMVQAGQINAVVPFDVANTGDAKIVIDNNGSKSAAYGIGVANTAAAIFTADGSGKGQAYVLNQDFTANAASNAAAKGSTITIFCTGLGQTKPAGASGMFVTSGALPAVANIGLKIGDQTATVQFAGAVPYGWPGLYQIIATVPTGAPAGDKVPVVINGSKQTGATIAVK